jgi:long-chain acyl-CoA synthetase
MDIPTSYLDKPWLKSYKLGPYKLEASLAPYPEAPVYTALDEAAAKYPGQTAILSQERTIKYSQLRKLVDRFACGLAGLGIEKGDRVSLFLNNCFEFIIGDWAIQKAGAAVVPTSPLRSQEGLAHEVVTSASKAILCQERDLEKVLAIRDQCDLKHVIVASDQGYDIDKAKMPAESGLHDFRELIETGQDASLEVQIDPRVDLCALAFTGGATGKPKGVMISHYNRFSCIQLGLPWLLKPVERGFVGKSSVLISVPLFHTYGHYIHQSAAYLGLRIILLPDPRDQKALVEAIQRYRPFLIPTVPTQLMRISEANLSRLNSLLMSGAAPLPPEVAQAIKSKIGMPVSEGYGLTETSPVTHFNVSTFSRVTGFMSQEKTGIGVPAPDTECKLVDPESGREVPFGEPGEVCVRGPQVMRGYWPEPGSGLTQDGWLHTGDIGVMDEDGYFRIVDRIKDMVNVSGLKVYTNELDDILYQHPAVLMAAAYGVPDPQLPGSERVMASIQLKEGYASQISAGDIQAFCRKHMAPYAVPKFVEFREDMPLTVTEKVFKKVLREEAIAKLKQTTPQDEDRTEA